MIAPCCNDQFSMLLSFITWQLFMWDFFPLVKTPHSSGYSNTLTSSPTLWWWLRLACHPWPVTSTNTHPYDHGTPTCRRRRTIPYQQPSQIRSSTYISGQRYHIENKRYRKDTAYPTSSCGGQQPVIEFMARLISSSEFPSTYLGRYC
jgi:hypothetical protein